jgi:hypothetical protein
VSMLGGVCACGGVVALWHACAVSLIGCYWNFHEGHNNSQQKMDPAALCLQISTVTTPTLSKRFVPPDQL